MKIDYSNYAVVINPFIHEEAKIKREEFLERVNNVKYIRTASSRISIYFDSIDSYNYFLSFHDIVNKGIFSSTIFSKDFLVAIPPRLFTWFKNNDIDLIKKQIFCWLASIYYFDDKESIEMHIYPPVLNEIKNIVEKYYSKFKIDKFEIDSILTITDKEIDLLEKYEIEKQNIYLKVCDEYYNSLPPDILKTPCDFPVDAKFVSNEYEIEWGLQPSYFGFDILISYFTNRDWSNIIKKKGSTDSLNRAESNSDLWEKWKYTYSIYPQSKEHIYKLIKNKDNIGFIYVIREDNSNKCKIGWTKNPEIEYKRLSQLQTGNPDKIRLIGAFKTVNRKTESILHEYFSDKHISGEWFLLDQIEIDKILNSVWRVTNNIF